MKSPFPGMDPYLEAHWGDGRYGRLDYRADPVPRLGESEARWADALLREKGIR